jgi:hypothetical protein
MSQASTQEDPSVFVDEHAWLDFGVQSGEVREREEE